MGITPRLSVNLNKIALLRNSRRTGSPDLIRFAELARQAGADGFTVHPRPDERHITAEDVTRLAHWMAPWRPSLELNIEGYPDDRLLKIVAAVGPEQCTLVPDEANALTSEKGWEFDSVQTQLLRSRLPEFMHESGRVVLFIDPDPGLIPKVAALGASGVEIYTGSYASKFSSHDSRSVGEAILATARAARHSGLIVNIGHDLTLTNIMGLATILPYISEASIGHELIIDALANGLPETVKKYRSTLRGSGSR